MLCKREGLARCACLSRSPVSCEHVFTTCCVKPRDRGPDQSQHLSSTTFDGQSPCVLHGHVSPVFPLGSSSLGTLGTSTPLISVNCARELLKLSKHPSSVLIMDCTFKLFQDIEALATDQGWSSCRPAWPLGEPLTAQPNFVGRKGRMER